MNEKMKISQIKNDDGKFTENKMQALYNFLCSANHGDVLNVINSGSKSNIDEEKKKELYKAKLKRMVETAYPEYPGKVDQFDLLFYIYINLLQNSEYDEYVALGKVLGYIDYVYNNQRLDVDRATAYALLSRVEMRDGNFRVKGNTKTVCEEMDRIRAHNVKISRGKIAYANKYKEATNLYLTKIKVERDLVNRLLNIIKAEADFINDINGKINSAESTSQQEELINIKLEKQQLVERRIQELLADENREGKDSVLVRLISVCHKEFLEYFMKYKTLEKNPKWFIDEFVSSESKYEVVMKDGFEESGKSDFRYKFNFMSVLGGLPCGIFSNRELLEITYQNLTRKLNEGQETTSKIDAQQYEMSKKRSGR